MTSTIRYHVRIATRQIKDPEFNQWRYKPLLCEMIAITAKLLFRSISTGTRHTFRTEQRKNKYMWALFFSSMISFRIFVLLVCEVTGVLTHNFIFWIYGFFRVLFPFRIQDIRFGEFECCYLILFCARISKPSLECVTVFCRDIAFNADALAISLCYWPDTTSTI